MFLFRTILLFLSFFLLVLQPFLVFGEDRVLEGFVFRMIPNLLLLLWFILTLVSKDKLRPNPALFPKKALQVLKLLRPLSGGSIILGALFRLLHYSGSYLLITSGIGCMAVYSLLVYLYAERVRNYNPDILDDEHAE